MEGDTDLDSRLLVRDVFKRNKPRRVFSSRLFMKEGGFLLSRIALQYHRRKWA